MPRSCLWTILCLPLAALPGRAEEKKLSPQEIQFFEAKVRPVLVENCLKCHGSEKQRGELRLDSLAAALKGGNRGPALVPGKPADSLLVQSIGHAEQLKMPPKTRLKDQEIADLTLWVKMGAPWPAGDATLTVRKGEFQISDKDRAHWAFQPVKRPPVPEVKNRAWAANPIDAFILAKLEAKGLRPNPPASKRELIRRVYYDLTGLPPTPQEVEAFVADPSPTAYEALVDRLLSSPRYGEKWARHWLDLVRFAETNSYERDGPKPHAWRYRDYVIRSFNDDKPYDRFVTEQLAGDELPDPDADAVIATGYYRLGIWDDEPSDRELARYDGLDDLVATTGQVFLGLTFDCARCHDHKIDPIPQKDYYRLLAFFHNINHFRNGGPTDVRMVGNDPAARRAYEERQRELDKKRDEIQAAMTAVEKDFITRYEKAQNERVRRVDLDELTYRYYRDSWTKLPDFDALKPEESGKLPKQLFDLAPRTRDTAFGFVFEGVLIVPEAGKYTFYLDSDDGSRLSVNGKKVLEYDGIHGEGAEQKAVVELPKGRLPIRLEYFQNENGFGLKAAWSGPGFERRSLSAGEQKTDLAKGEFSRLFKNDGERILGKETVQRYGQLKRELDGLKKQTLSAELALCVTEAGRQPPETFVLLRGNPQTKGDKVEPAFPLILDGPKVVIPELPANVKSCGRRLALANWIASKDNRLTARVMANRVWQYHFGRGIVRSSSNFGLQGDKPTHPELLDWLASEFVARGWRLKPLHRLILTSNAYRMSSRGNAEALAADPANDLFWRFDMRRLTAEEIRDSILATTGTLNPKMYGPGVYVDIPKEVLAGQSMPGHGWGKSPPEEQARRSIYIHVKRSLLTPILEHFDAAETDRSSPSRFATTQPAQALAMLNSEFLNKQADLFAARLRKEAGDDPAKQVRLALNLATARPPTATEVQRGVKLIASLQEKDAVSKEAALRYFCLVVLNLNEFVYLD